MTVVNARRLIWLSPFLGPAIATVMSLIGRMLHIPGAEKLDTVFFVVATFLNVIFALPILLFLRYLKRSSLLLFMGLAAAMVAFPAFLLSAPLITFEPLPERGFYLLPLALFISLGAVTGACFCAGVRRTNCSNDCRACA
jgi:hypothetical protein